MDDDKELCKMIAWIALLVSLAVVGIICTHEYWKERERKDFLEAGYEMHIDRGGYISWCSPKGKGVEK